VKRIYFRPAISKTLQDGFTLIEILIALVILGLAVVALLGGLTLAVSGSNLHRSQAAVDSALVFASEQVKSETYTTCNPSPPAGSDREPTYIDVIHHTWLVPQYSTSVYTTWPVYTSVPGNLPAATGFFVVSVQSWDGSNWFAASTSSGLQCPSTDDVEKVSITAYAVVSKVTQSVDVLKGNWN
jgi:prepilin-type N-terminal cleavage/methylation domain-containing protein